MKYFGYSLSNNGEFGLILYAGKDTSNYLVPAHELLETLKEEIGDKYPFTVSIGCTRLNSDDLGMPDDWYERANKNLKYAQKNGGNEICFGIDASKELKESKESTECKINNDEEDDRIEKKSIAAIHVRLCVAVCCFVFCH